MKRVRNLTLFTVFTLTLGIIFAGGVLSYRQARFLIDPPLVPLNGSRPVDAQDVSFTSADGLTLYGWYVPPTHPTSGAAILFIHGHGSNRELLIAEATLYAELGYGLLLFDMRNHGESDGDRTTMGLDEVADVQAAFAFLAAQPEVDGERIALYGHSMGGATAIRAMARIPAARALVARAAYTSIEDVISDGVRRMTAGLMSFPFREMTLAFMNNMSASEIHAVRPIDDIATIAPRPVMLVHGIDDEVVPYHHSERLFAAAGEPKAFYDVDGALHGNIYQSDPTAYTDNVPLFLESALRGD